MKRNFKRILSVFTAALMLSGILPILAECGINGGTVWDGTIADSFAGGTGTEANPYLIADGSQLAYLAQQVNSGETYNNTYFNMTNDICLNDTANWENWDTEPPAEEWTPIGYYGVTSTEQIFNPFMGSFNGCGFSVSGVYINKAGNGEDAKYQGLFGCNCGKIRNLNLNASYIHGFMYIGGITGGCTGTVINCYNEGAVNGSNAVGGVVGYNSGNSLVSECRNAGNVSGEFNIGGVIGENYLNNIPVAGCVNLGSVIGAGWVGGVIGSNNDGFAADCFNEGSVSGTDMYIGGIAGGCTGSISASRNSGSITGGENGSIVGGIAGYNDTGAGNISDCYNTGSVHGSNQIGGIVGVKWSGNDPVIACYNAGCVTGNSNIGAVAGQNDGSIYCCYYLDTSCAQGDANASALTDLQMQSAENFVGFNFERIWTMEGDSIYLYPELNHLYNVTFRDETTQEEIGENLIVSAGTVLTESDFPEAPVHQGYDFIGWDYKNVPIHSDTVVTAEYYNPNTIGFYFESDPYAEGWESQDNDGDGFNWEWVHNTNEFNIPEGQGCMVSQSFDNDLGELTPDNWLISPAVLGGGSVNFKFVGQDPNYAAEVIGVYVTSDNGQTWSDELGRYTATGDIQKETVDLTPFAGQNIRIAFRHYDVSGQFYINLDAVEVIPGGSGNVLPGDYDCNGTVNVQDAILTLRAAMGLITPSAQSLLNADIDGSGILTVADAITVLRMAMGLI